MKKKIALILALALCLCVIFALCISAEGASQAPETSSQQPIVPETNGGDGAENKGELQFKFDGSSLGKTVPILCTGMLGIFIVTGIIIAIVLILNTTMTVINNKKQNKENK